MRLAVKSFKAFSELVRLEHGILYGLGVLIGAILSGWDISFSSILLSGFIATVLAEFGAFALNDYFDVKADIANRRTDRPIVRKEVSKDAAFLIAVCSLTLSNAVAFMMLGGAAFYVVLAFSILSVMYNAVLKHLPLVGNLFIAATMAVPFVFGGLLFGRISEPVIFLAAIAFAVGVGREVMKDTEDIGGDRKVGAKTLPIAIGAKGAAYVAAGCYLVSVILSLIPFFTFFKGNLPYSLVLITDALLLVLSYKLLMDQKLQTLRFGRKWSFYAVVVGLVAFLMASL